MKRLWLLFAQCCTLLLCTYFLVGTLKPQWLGGSRSRFGLVAVPQASPRRPPPHGNFRLPAHRDPPTVGTPPPTPATPPSTQ